MVRRPRASPLCPYTTLFRSLVDDADDIGQRGQDGRDSLLRRRLVPVAGHRTDDLEFGMSGDTFEDAGMDGIIDRGPGQAADFQQVPALGLEIRGLAGTSIDD